MIDAVTPQKSNSSPQPALPNGATKELSLTPLPSLFTNGSLLTATKQYCQTSLPSPKSTILDKIQQNNKTADETTVQCTTTTADSSTNKSQQQQQKETPIISVTDTDSDSLKFPTVIDTELSNSSSLPESSKSPILSLPKTIRFPANGSRRTDNRVAGYCYWDDCNENCETSSNLLDHLQTKHVNPQTVPFSCRWANCKVHARESCSRKWLERHVLSHGGSKLFKCIFDKCRLRFGSQVN